MGVPVYRTASTVPQYTDISVYRYTPSENIVHSNLVSTRRSGSTDLVRVISESRTNDGHINRSLPAAGLKNHLLLWYLLMYCIPSHQ